MSYFSGLRILITGAGTGIGALLARALAAQGAEVIVTALTKSEAEAVCNEIADAGGIAHPMALDVSRWGAIEDFRAHLHETTGGLVDVLINNAGVVFGGAFDKVDLDTHLKTYAVNTLGPVAVSHAFMNDLICSRRGHIVNIASASAYVGLPFGSTYASSKWAVLGFSESLRLELRTRRIRHVHVTTVCPSYINTGMFEGVKAPLLAPILEPDEVVDAILEAVRKKRPLVQLPSVVRWLDLFKGLLPLCIWDRVAELTGISTSMKHWRGRSAPTVEAIETATTPSHAIDRAIDTLTRCADTWANLDIRTRIGLLERLAHCVSAHAREWVDAAVKAKGLTPDSPLAGEEWLSGPYAVITWVDAHRRALERLQRGENTYKPQWVSTRSDGQTTVQILPSGWEDSLLLNGYRAEVWMAPEVTPANLSENTAGLYRQATRKGRVCAVLGAGNIASITPLDVLYKLFAENQVAVLKMNPVNQYLGETLEKIFHEFISQGFVRMVYGGSEVGAYLTRHHGIDTIHVTGSERTHNLIVFGGGSEGEARRRCDEPLLEKPVTSELGGVSPTIVVPGPWSESDLRYQAENFAAQKLHNGGFNCVASQVLVLPQDWELTNRFVALVEQCIAEAPPRVAYYPGATDRYHSIVERREPDTKLLDPSNLRAHLRNVPFDSGSFAFNEEFFVPVFASTRLPGDTRNPGDVGAYLEAAVAFANDALHGTLGASIMIHPKTMAELGARFEQAIADLRYGCLGINVWSGFGFSAPGGAWGGYPGTPLNDVGSGRGIVHNALLFDRPQRTVVRGPFRPIPRAWFRGEFHLAPRPPWFVTNRTAARTARLLTEYAAERRVTTLLPLFASALRG